MRLLLALVLLFTAPQTTTTYHLTVIGGSGSGDYACGSTVDIVGNETNGKKVFTEWANPNWDGTGIERVRERKTRLKMPCHDVTVEARFSEPAPKGKP